MRFSTLFGAILAALFITGCGGGRSASGNPYEKPGYVTEVNEDGRLYIVPEGSEFATEEGIEIPEKNIVTSIGAGPEGMTIRSDSKDTTNGYLAQKEGFVVNINDGRIYVVTTDSPNNHDGVVEISEKDIITKIGAGVGNMTVRSDSIETINAYLAAK